MGDLILTALAILVFSAIWIEWAPHRYNAILHVVIDLSLVVAGLSAIPNALGWFLILAAIADLIRVYFKSGGKFNWPEFRRWCSRQPLPASELPAADPKPEALPNLKKTSLVSLGLLISSPFAAIPTMMTLMAYMVLASSSDPLMFDTKRWLGYTIVGIVAAADVVAKQLLWLIPLGGLAFLGARKLIKEPFNWRRFLMVWFMLGAFYPLLYLLADNFGWFDGPFFN